MYKFNKVEIRDTICINENCKNNIESIKVLYSYLLLLQFKDHFCY